MNVNSGEHNVGVGKITWSFPKLEVVSLTFDKTYTVHFSLYSSFLSVNIRWNFHAFYFFLFSLTERNIAQQTRGWVQLTKVTFLGQRSYHRFKYKSWSSSESRPSINFKISNSTKIEIQNIDPASETQQTFNFITSTKHKGQNTKQNPASRSCLNFNFNILTKPCAQSLNKSLALWPKFSS